MGFAHEIVGPINDIVKAHAKPRVDGAFYNSLTSAILKSGTKEPIVALHVLNEINAHQDFQMDQLLPIFKYKVKQKGRDVTVQYEITSEPEDKHNRTNFHLLTIFTWCANGKLLDFTVKRRGWLKRMFPYP